MSTLGAALAIAACGGGEDGSQSGSAERSAGAPNEIDPSPPSKAKGEPIVIGVVEDRSGPAATISKQQVDILELVAAQLNAGNALYAEEAVSSTPGIDGRSIKLISEDDQGNPNLTVLRAQKLVDRGASAIVLTSTSAAAIQARVVCQKENVPCISPSNINPAVIAPPNNEYIFTVAPSITLLASGMAEAFKELGYDEIGFYLADDPNQAALMELFAGELEGAGMDVVAREILPQGATDNTSQLLRMKDADPDAIMNLSATPSAIAQLYQTRLRVGLDIPIWDSTALTGEPAAWELAGKALDGALAMDSFDPDNPSTRQLAEVYQAAHPGKPMIVMIPQTADTLLLLKAAIETAGTTDGPEVRDALERIEDFPSGYGPEGYRLSFSPENHNAASPEALAVLEFEDERPHLWDEFQPTSPAS